MRQNLPCVSFVAIYETQICLCIFGKTQSIVASYIAGLQAVDLFSWGIFRKYENGDYGWYTIYWHKIRFETEYLP